MNSSINDHVTVESFEQITDVTATDDQNVTTLFDNVTGIEHVTITEALSRLEPYQNFKDITDTILGIIILLIMVVILTGNILVLTIFTRFKKLRTAANIFVVSLSCADTLVGIGTIPFYSALFLFRHLNHIKYLCVMKFVFVLGSLCSSLLSLLAIAYDRYVAICNPLKYSIIMTKSRAKKIVAAIWVYTAIMSLIPLYLNNFDPIPKNPCNFYKIFPVEYTGFVSYASTFLVQLIAFILYVRIFIVAKAHRSAHLKRKARMTGKALSQFRKDTKSAKMMALIMFLFFVFWLPLQATGPLGYLNLPENLTEIVKNFTLCLAFSNSFVNPIIYCWLKNDFKFAIRQLLSSKAEKAKGVVNATNSTTSTQVESISRWQEDSVSKNINGNSHSDLEEDMGLENQNYNYNE